MKQLGDCLGRGAFGSVYRALNWNTGETVAVKQIKLTDLPKSELRVIMVMLFRVPCCQNYITNGLWVVVGD